MSLSETEGRASRKKTELTARPTCLVLSRRPDFEARKAEIQEKNSQLADAAEQVLNVIANPEVAGQLKQDKDQNMIWLKEHYGVRLLLPLSLF